MMASACDLQKVDWVWEMLKLVFAPATLPGADLPRVIFYDDFGQVDRKEWLCIQEAVVINDRRARLSGRRIPEALIRPICWKWSIRRHNSLLRGTTPAQLLPKVVRSDQRQAGHATNDDTHGT